METPGPGVFKLDEKWLLEWFNDGWSELIEYLTKVAALDAWCAEHRKEPA